MSIALYVHFPFCFSKCYYCDFVSYANAGDKMQPYTQALIKELCRQSEKLSNQQVTSIYFGGGTPSVMPHQCMTEIATAIKDNFCISQDVEWSTELNPESAVMPFIKHMQELGVNRFSVGLQSAIDSELRAVGRPHTRKDFVNTVTALRKCAITNINADIMLGLPNQTLQSVNETLELLLQLRIPHISAYGLKLEPKTRLKQMVDLNQIKLPSEDDAVAMYDAVYTKLEENKIYRYEVSNFAQVGMECRHNLNYWNWGRYLGVGVSAHSFIGDVRYANVSDIDNYIYKLSVDKLPVTKRHKLQLKEAEFEFIMLALRLERGLDISRFNQTFVTDFIAKYQFILTKLEKMGVIVYDTHFVNVVSEKMYLLNSVLVEFLQ